MSSRNVVMDLGGTRLKIGVADAAGSIVKRDAVDITSNDRDYLLNLIASAGTLILDGSPAASAGLCVPGLSEKGTIVSLPGKLDGVVGVDLAAFLRETFGTADVVVSHDGVAYATGEASAGAGVGADRVVVMTIGTGIGVAVMQNGLPVTAGMFGAGILGGFIPIADDAGGPQTDSTGQRDTIEALCAAEQIVALAGGAYANIPDIYAAHARDEAPAVRAVDAYRSRLVKAIVALAHAHAPERIVLGGGPMQPDNPIVEGVEEAVNARLFGTYRVEVQLAALGDDAALIGLIHLLRDAR